MVHFSTAQLRSALLLLSLLFYSKSWAQYDSNHTYKIVSKSNGLALRIQQFDGNPANIYNQAIYLDATGDTGNAYQQWYIKDIGGGLYKIENSDTRQCLEISYRTRYTNVLNAYNSGMMVSMANFTNDDGQKWSFTNVSGQTLITNYKSGLTLRCRLAYSRDYYDILQDEYLPSTPDSGWDIIDVSRNPGNVYAQGEFQVVNVYSNKALTIEPGNIDDWSVKQMTAWGLGCERWVFQPSNTPGYYKLINRRINGKILEIGGDPSHQYEGGAKANIWYDYTYDGQHGNQEWALIDVNTSQQVTFDQVLNNNLTFKLYNRKSGQVLEIGGAGTNDGDTANQWYDYNHPWQQWRVAFNSYNRMAYTPTPTSGAASSSANSAKGDSDMTVYPNPAQNKLSIQLPEGMQLSYCKVVVTDLRGSIVSTAKQLDGVDISGLASGVYFISVFDGVNQYRKKFVKE